MHRPGGGSPACATQRVARCSVPRARREPTADLAPISPASSRLVRRFADARCLVTGASSGIGRAVAERLAMAGASVVLTGRNRPRLEEVVGCLHDAGVPANRLHLETADLTQADDRCRLLASTDKAFDGSLDLLVNAAGVGAYGPFLTHDPTILTRLLDLNVVALAELCRLAHPLLRGGVRAAVVNLGSIVARRGLPGRSEYSASKFAVAGLTEALRAEWSFDGIHVVLVNPGFTATAFERNALIDTAYHRTADHRNMGAEAVASRLLDALVRQRNEVTLTAGGRLLLAVNRLAPRFVDHRLGAWVRALYRRSGLVPVGRAGR
jgi:short-subunit dehydrogenase